VGNVHAYVRVAGLAGAGCVATDDLELRAKRGTPNAARATIRAKVERDHAAATRTGPRP
jgi:hypothetical protein